MDTTRTTLSLFDEASTRKKVVLAVAFAALCVSQGLTNGPFVGADDFVEVEIAGSQMDVPGAGNCVDLDDFGTAACAVARVKAMTEFVSTQSEDLLTGEEPEEDAAEDSEASLDILFAGLETGEPLIANVSGDGFTKPRNQQAGSAMPWANSGGGSRVAALGSGLPSFSGAGGGYGGNGGAPSSAPATDFATDNDVVDEIDTAPVAQRRVADTTPSKGGDDVVAASSDDEDEIEKEIDKDSHGGGGPTFAAGGVDPQEEDEPSEECDTETESCETDPSDGEPANTGTEEVADTDGPQDEGTGNDDTGNDDTGNDDTGNDDTGNDDGSDDGGPDNSGPVGDPFEDDLVVVDPEDPTGEPPGYLPPTGPPFFPPVVPDEPNDDAGNGTAADVPVPSTLALFLLAAFGLRLRRRA